MCNDLERIIRYQGTTTLIKHKVTFIYAFLKIYRVLKDDEKRQMKRSITELDRFYYKDLKKPKISEDYGSLDFKFYQRWLCLLTNPTAIYLRDKVLDIKSHNAFGMSYLKVNPKSFLAWTLKEKAKNPRCILAIQVGDFFEFCGIDAIFTVEFGGLRAMGKIPTMKSGTPLSSLQRLLDSLIENGLTIRVYEEFGDCIKTQYKKRDICQVVSKSNPVYFRALNSIEDDSVREGRPIIYLMSDQVLTVDIVSRTYTLYRGLSSRSMTALISSTRPSEVYSIPTLRKVVPVNFHTQTILSTDSLYNIINKLKDIYEINQEFVESERDINRIPLMKSTSDQLGIASTVDCIPDVISSALGKASHIERRFLTNWVLVKPTVHGRYAMERVCQGISKGDIIVKNIRPLDPDKIYGLLSSGGICKDSSLLVKLHNRLVQKLEEQDLHTVAREHMGVSQNFSDYIIETREIENLLASNLVNNSEYCDDGVIPSDFVNRNELYIVNVPSMSDMKELRYKLESLLSVSFDDGFRLTYYPLENDIAFSHKTKPDFEGVIQSSNKKGLRKYTWTTVELSALVAEYLQSCETCLKDQFKLIKSISSRLTGKFGKSLRVFLQCEVVAKCIHTHLANVICKGWNSAVVGKGENSEIVVEKGFPHWLSCSDSTLNSLKMVKGELFLLTAPNATGKTTLIRSLMISAVLAHAGIYVPAKKAHFPDMNHFFLRLPGSDRPAEGLSSFEAEIQDLQLMLDAVDTRTIICLDELARSTCPREGTAIAQSVIEFLLTKSCFCIFATHLHELLDKKLGVKYMTMLDNHSYVEGESRTSKALDVCRKHNINPIIIDRAAEILGVSISNTDNPVEITKDIVEEIAVRITGVKAFHIPLGTLIPPQLTSSPCVYIIRERKNLWYCGESKHVINRQKQHGFHNERFGDIMVFPVDNKTVAMKYETLIQRRCIEKGINLSSIQDSYHNL